LQNNEIKLKKLLIIVFFIAGLTVSNAQENPGPTEFRSKKEWKKARKEERKHKKMVRKHHKRVNKENTMIIDKKTYKRMKKTEKTSKRRVNKNKPRTPWIKKIFKKKRY
jgi:Ni/Co efflux regulator RcnB